MGGQGSIAHDLLLAYGDRLDRLEQLMVALETKVNRIGELSADGLDTLNNNQQRVHLTTTALAVAMQSFEEDIAVVKIRLNELAEGIAW